MKVIKFLLVAVLFVSIVAFAWHHGMDLGTALYENSHSDPAATGGKV